ncbi:hypothetical protein HHI36_017855, partial [Cryptolaemus montrouzieri]
NAAKRKKDCRVFHLDEEDFAEGIPKFLDSDDGNELEESNTENVDGRTDRENSRHDDPDFDSDVELLTHESDVECGRECSPTSKKISSPLRPFTSLAITFYSSESPHLESYLSDNEYESRSLSQTRETSSPSLQPLVGNNKQDGEDETRCSLPDHSE